MPDTLLAKNKKAWFDYEVLEKLEAGIMLSGAEVKSAKAGRVQLKGSHVTIEGGRAWLEKAHISPYDFARGQEYNPNRRRQLLLHKKELLHLAGLLNEKGIALVPLELYLKKQLIKLSIGVCRGKKKYDKRHDLKKKAMQKEVAQSLKSSLREG
ncbi:SsrA-binding protein [Candidatus Peregrinibacteria bacterium CG11_big_fil_rev_8_21_14_0_20_46_8]|nr:MAG: SsrA-binding protein [Candidatus Peregrinibacteria bacterium CG11_big_fil_rev_8_21_14_0_20_46_8]